MDASNGRRKPVRLSAETKWEIFLAITQGEVSQAEAARRWRGGCVGDQSRYAAR